MTTTTEAPLFDPAEADQLREAAKTSTLHGYGAEQDEGAWLQALKMAYGTPGQLIGHVKALRAFEDGTTAGFDAVNDLIHSHERALGVLAHSTLAAHCENAAIRERLSHHDDTLTYLAGRDQPDRRATCRGIASSEHRLGLLLLMAASMVVALVVGVAVGAWIA